MSYERVPFTQFWAILYPHRCCVCQSDLTGRTRKPENLHFLVVMMVLNRCGEYLKIAWKFVKFLILQYRYDKLEELEASCSWAGWEHEWRGIESNDRRVRYRRNGRKWVYLLCTCLDASSTELVTNYITLSHDTLETLFRSFFCFFFQVSNSWPVIC